MSKRYSGPYSPDPADPRGAPAPGNGVNADAAPPRPVVNAPRPFEGKRRRRGAGRVNFMFFAALPFAATAFGRSPVNMTESLMAFGLLILAAWLTREGITAQYAWEERAIARRPAIPRKIFGSVLTGAALTLGGFAADAGTVVPFLYGLLGAGLHFMSFGPDPLKNKGAEGFDAFESDRVARAVDDAEKRLVAMTDAIRPAGDRQLEARVARFADTARKMFRTIEEDPRDLTASRKYLSVYLQGARDATVKYAGLRNRDAGARADYVALMDDLEANFSARTQLLLTDNRDDLNIEIEVLRDRLRRDGLTIAPNSPDQNSPAVHSNE